MDTLYALSKEHFGITLTDSQLVSFNKYSESLLEWNKSFNLTAIRDSDNIRIKHFLDSLSCLSVIKNTESINLIDIGTGAGFPGIPIKIALPNIKLTLVDSVGKKVSFCKHIVEALGLENTAVIHDRAEELGRSPRSIVKNTIGLLPELCQIYPH